MDVPTHHFLHPPPPSPSPSPSRGGSAIDNESNSGMNLYGKSKGNNPFAVGDPVCSINLRETSDFVKSLPTSNGSSRADSSSAQRRREGSNTNTSSSASVSLTQQRRVIETPSTPGRPVFSFTSSTVAGKSFPPKSKWEDAEKWLMSTSSSPNLSSHCHNFKEQRVSKPVPNFQGSAPSLDHHYTISSSTDIVLKDKFTDSTEPIFPNFRYLQPTKEGFLFRNPVGEAMKDACTEVVHNDAGTEMTPLGSSTTSRCHTPFKSSSPARHNTPASRSGPLSLANHDNTCCTIDLIRLEECHFAKLQLGTQYDSVASRWSSREEEEEEISKSLRHNASQKADSDCRATTWEEEERTKFCLRYQREEAKIQAWVDLQGAKAEAQLRKLEVKIQKMRSNLEEKLMKRMAVVHRKAEDWRAAARQQHLEQTQRASEQAHKIMMQHTNSLVSGHNSCGCFPCSNNHL